MKNNMSASQFNIISNETYLKYVIYDMKLIYFIFKTMFESD